MKRRPTQITNIEENTSKKQKIDLLPYNDILRPLIDSNKILENGKKIPEQDRYNNSAYRDFIRHDTEDIKNSQRQLGQFITEQLARLSQGIPKKAFDAFNSLNIRTKPPELEESGSESTTDEDPYLDDLYEDRLVYDPNNMSIALNTFVNPLDPLNNPLVTLIHEGTHALDDLYMRNSQEAAINTLAKMEQPIKQSDERNLLTQDRSWYNQAQSILDSPSFITHYPLGGYIEVADNEQESEANSYGANRLDKEQRRMITRLKKPIKNFRDTRDLIGNRTDNYQNGFFEEPFTEFTAYSVENLHRPWNIHNNQNDKKTGNYWEYFNDGRRFLKAITKGVYRNFRELDPEFSTNYSDANQAFLDRITQLRNYDKLKGQTEDAYKKHLYERFPQRNPSYNLPQSNNTMPPHPFQGNAEYNTPHAQYNNVSPENLPQLGSFSNDNEDDFLLSLMPEDYQLPEGFDNNLAENNLEYNATPEGSPQNPYLQDSYLSQRSPKY